MQQAGSPVDLLPAFCISFAFNVHCDVLGVPEQFRDALQYWSLRRSRQPGVTVQHVHDAEIGLQCVVADA